MRLASLGKKGEIFIKYKGYKTPMLLTYKTRFYPTQPQEEILWALSEKCRLLYNFALAERIENWENNKDKPKDERKYTSYIDQQNKLSDLKEQYPEYKWVYSKVLQMTLKTLDANYKSFFSLWKKGDKTTRPPKYKGKTHFITLKYNQSGFKLEKEVLTLSHKHPSKTELNFHISYRPQGKIRQIDLFYEKFTDKWFVSFTCNVETPKYSDNGQYQAFDTGITNIVSAVNSKGKTIQIKNRRPEKYWKSKIVEVQSRQDHCKKYSKKWYHYNRKKIKLQRKLSNQLKDFQHKISKKIVDNTKANTLIFGKVNINQMTNKNKRKYNKTLNYSLQNTGSISRFIKFVTYKAQKIGKRVIQIDESYTTKICPLCGVMKDRKLSERNIKCDCGHQMDRDLSSAINILAKFYLQKDQFDELSQKPSVDEESFLNKWKGFLQQTAKGKTKVPLSGFQKRFGGLAGSSIL